MKLRVALSACVLSWTLCGQSGSTDISGTWVAKRQGPMGETEAVFRLKVDTATGRITGSQTLMFGDSPIVDGKIAGDEFEYTVETESFGEISRQTGKGKIVGDELHITPPMPQRRPPGGGGPGGGPGGPGGPPPGFGPGGPGGGPRGMMNGPWIAKRGTPTPSYRAPTVDYRTLPKVELPAIKDLAPNSLAKTPPMGWNSWNKFRTRIDDKTIREIADAMVANGMKAAGYQYINIDDGWQHKRDEAGVLQANANFPNMKALADYVHSKGLKIGIYSSPGPRTCGGYEGSYGHEEIDAQTWAGWGIDYLKYDWCSASRIWKDEDMRAAYQRMGEAIGNAGRPMVYALCQYGRAKVQEWGPKVAANVWRTTGDIRDAWQSMAQIGFSQSDLGTFAGPGHWNDPDMLEVGNGGMTAEEYRTHFSLWAMLASPLLAGNDLRNMPPETLAILTNKEAIAVNQDRLGKGGQRVLKEGETEVWLKPLDKRQYAVALFNRGAAEAEVTANWADLKLAPGAYKVRDVWAHADRGKQAKGISAKVPPHGVALVRLAR